MAVIGTQTPLSSTPRAPVLIERRLQNWHQTEGSAIPGWEAAAQLISDTHLVTHYPASSEVANIFQAHMGDPTAKADPEWDSPSGQVYAWRWSLGRAEIAFYTSLVRKRPTWISWDLLPAMLRLRGEMRTPHELADLGIISAGALRICEALEAAGGVQSTGELRRDAGFPTGKENRAAYLKAVEELESRLMLGKVFLDDGQSEGDRMSHALVSSRYAPHLRAAEKLTAEVATDTFLRLYLPSAAFASPLLLSRHLGISGPDLKAGLGRLVHSENAQVEPITGYKGECYVWL